MNPTVILSLVSAVCFSIAAVFIVLGRKETGTNSGVILPLVISILLYDFIVLSNFMEHSGITAFFDPIEDIAETVFPFILLLFVNNWRKDRSLKIIRDQEIWLQDTVESIEDGIMTTDRNGRILKINKTMEKLTGWTEEMALGKQESDLLVFMDKNTRLKIDYNPFFEALNSKTSSKYPHGVLLKSREGKATLVADKTSTIRNSQGRILGAVGIFRDMGDYEALNEQLMHMHKMEAVGQLAGGIAHDLNNMIGGVMGAADLLKENFTEKGITEFDGIMDIIANSSDNAKELTSNLLALSRREKVVPVPLDIQEIIKKTLSISESTVNKTVNIGASYSEEPLIIKGDASQLQNAILNLVLNARDAIHNRGEIIISAKKVNVDDDWNNKREFSVSPGDYACISVKDNGPGIPQEYKNRIFEPFFTTKEEGKGTGLGLAAVYGTVTSHGGAIQLNTGPDSGTEFLLYFPITSERNSKPEVQGNSSGPKNGKVLIIEDDDILRSSVNMMLTQNNYITYCAATGEDGLSLYKEHSRDIDIVLLDIVMPGIQGTEVYRRLREINPEVKVLITSGYTQIENIPAGIIGFLKKPFHSNELINMINEAIIS